jgi:glyoxylase-like metal-dependent hydrolase (beta-lactamase superfamily II)
VRVGSIELDPVVDAWGELGELGELYPETPIEAWEPYRELYADLFAGTRWRLPCTCYLVRSAGRVVLVDTGVGPPGSWGWTAEQEGGLLPGLAALGVEPEHVQFVFLTHIHIDHVGWNADGDAVPVFPNARYVLHADGLALASERADAPHIRRCLRSIVDAGLVDEVEAGEEIAPGVATIDLPGHLAGHLGLRLAQGAVLIADAAVHPALLDQPEWRYVSDAEPRTASETRQAMLRELEGRDVLVVCGHYPAGGIGRLVRRDGHVVWQAVTNP